MENTATHNILKSYKTNDGCFTCCELVQNDNIKLKPTAQILAKHLISNVLCDTAMGLRDTPTGSP
jgi:hypothetical protein